MCVVCPLCYTIHVCIPGQVFRKCDPHIACCDEGEIVQLVCGPDRGSLPGDPENFTLGRIKEQNANPKPIIADGLDHFGV